MLWRDRSIKAVYLETNSWSRQKSSCGGQANTLSTELHMHHPPPPAPISHTGFSNLTWKTDHCLLGEQGESDFPNKRFSIQHRSVWYWLLKDTLHSRIFRSELIYLFVCVFVYLFVCSSLIKQTVKKENVCKGRVRLETYSWASSINQKNGAGKR